VFSELGGKTTKAANNRYAYNLYSSARADSRFIVTRGGKSTYGPVYNTVLNHNTAYQTGARSQGIVCELGCSKGILTVSGSIFWAEQKTVYADAPFNLSNSLIWSSAGDPVLQIGGTPALPNVITADPLFKGAARGDFSLAAGSVAIDGDFAGALAGTDLRNVAVPQGTRGDQGSFEFVG
jgi:hypothetical protein